MTNKQRFFKQALIKQVHTSKLWFDVYSHDRDLYETMLQNNFGVKSSKELDISQLMELVKFLNGQKFVSFKTEATKNQIAFLLSLWEQKSIAKDEKSLLMLIYTRFKISLNSIYDLPKKDFKKVIAVVQNLKAKEKNYDEHYAHSISKLKLNKGF
jgi:hypothetical protein